MVVVPGFGGCCERAGAGEKGEKARWRRRPRARKAKEALRSTPPRLNQHHHVHKKQKILTLANGARGAGTS